MNHIESSQKIFFSNEYARFKMINGNRQLNENKINKIIREIGSGNDMLRYYPIQVKKNNDRLDILDGQHRFFICKKLKRPVYYILVSEDKSMPEIAKINSNVEKWKPEDYINCYLQNGNTDYKIIQEYQDKYGFSLSVILKLLHDGNPGNEQHNDLNEDFKMGSFRVKHLDEAQKIGDTVHLFNTFSNYRSRAFVIAIYRIEKAGLVKIEELVDAYKKRPELLTQQANYKAYVNTLEQIINFGKKNRILLIQ